MTVGRALGGLVLALLAAWLLLVVALWTLKPRGSLLREALRLLPDTIVLLRRLAADRALPRGVRWRLWLAFAYLASPVDLVPDFLPIIGYADDVIVVLLVLRSVARAAGADAVRRHWPGSDEGLAALWRVVRLPGEAR